MPSCCICGRIAPAGRVIETVGIVCPKSRETDCYEQARNQADRRWMAEAEEDGLL